MVIRRSKSLVKKIFENQHKFEKTWVRFCSSSLRIQECEEPALSNVTFEDQSQQTKINKIYKPPYESIEPQPDITPDISFKFEDLQVRLAAPYQLQPKPDTLQFGKNFTDHMFKAFYYKQLGGWQKPEIVPMENLVLHPAAKVLHYAIEVFEGMKAYRGVDDKIRLFRPDLNMSRMNSSAKRMGLPNFDGEELIKCFQRLLSIDQEWVPHSESASLYLRPTFIAIDPTLGVASPDSAMLYTILSPVGSYFSANTTDGISLLADPSVTRAWPGGVGDRKAGSNYGPTIDAQSKASKLGLHQVLWLYGEDHQLTEVGTMNVFVVSLNSQGEKVLSTPPLNGLILPGITRKSIMQLAEQWNDIIIKEEVLTMKKLLQLSKEGRVLEIFGAGTACVVTPVEHIYYLDQKITIPTTSQSDAIYRRALDTLLAIQYGHIEHPWARTIDI